MDDTRGFDHSSQPKNLGIKSRGACASYNYFLFTITLLILAPLARAATNSGLTYHGRIIAPNGEPVETAGVQFKIQIRTPNANNCLLYEESKSVDMRGSKGIFSLTLNDGTGTKLTGSYQLDDAFSNRKPFVVVHSNLDCSSGNTYNPSSTDGRKFVVYFKEASASTWEQLAPMDIGFIPLALEAVKVGGFAPEDLLRINRNDPVNQTVNAFTFADYTKLVDLIAGTSNLFQRSGQLNGATITTPSTGQVLQWNGSSWVGHTPFVTELDPTVQAFAKTAVTNCSMGQVLSMVSGTLTCVTDATGGTPSDATTSSKGIVQVGSGLSVASGVLSLPDVVTADGYAFVNVNAKGNVTSGLTTLPDSKLDTITTAGKVSGSAITSGNISTSGDIATSGTLTSTGNISTPGNVTATGAVTATQVRLYDGSSNYITMLAPSMTTDYSLTWPVAIPSTPKVLQVTESSPGVGALSWVDMAAGGTGTVTQVTAGSGLATAPAAGITSTGSIAIATGGVTSSHLANDAVTTAAIATGAVGSDEIASGVVTDAKISDVAWTKITSHPTTLTGYGITDGVTSVGLSVPTFMSVTNSPVTSSNTMAVSFNSQTANQVFAGPLTGNSAPSFRLLEISDIRASSTGRPPFFNVSGACSNGQTLTYSSATDQVSCASYAVTSTQILNALGYTPANGADYIAKSGDTLTGTINLPSGGLKIGTTDFVMSGNKIGIGTASPDTTMHIYSTIPNGTAQPNRAGLIIESENDDYGGRIATRVWSSSEAPYFIGYRALGSKASPTALTGGKGIVHLVGYGYDGSGWSANSSSPLIALETDEVWTTTAKGSRITFSTAARGSTVSNERMRIAPSGNVGIGTDSPQATLDVNGDIRLKVNSSQPVSCNSTYNGRVALTSNYTMCVCKGGSSAWVRTTDGTTACSW